MRAGLQTGGKGRGAVLGKGQKAQGPTAWVRGVGRGLGSSSSSSSSSGQSGGVGQWGWRVQRATALQAGLGGAYAAKATAVSAAG